MWRILRRLGISLQRRRRWCVSTDPEFARKAADIIGLYLEPPENAVVLCVDEKPHIQARERAQGWLKLPNGKALTGFIMLTGVMALHRSLGPWKWLPAKSRPATIGDGDGWNF